MAKQKRTATRRPVKSQATPSAAAAQLQQLRRARDQQKRINALAKELVRAAERASVSVIQTARALATSVGWSVVDTNWLRALERENEVRAGHVEMVNLELARLRRETGESADTRADALAGK